MRGRHILRRYRIIVRHRIIEVVRIGTSKPMLVASRQLGNIMRKAA